MIKNIVFDMGKVMLDYEALKVCGVYTDREEDIRMLDEALFSSPEWILLDRGAITEEEAMVKVRKRLPDERMREMADRCMAHWHEYNISPMPGMGELVAKLKAAGYGIYLCSNASLRLRAYQNRIPGIEYFDGILVSAEEKLLKPDPAIFERLFEKFSIRLEESFFVDDIPANIAGAKSRGMDGYCFDGDVQKLREALRARGVAV